MGERAYSPAVLAADDPSAASDAPAAPARPYSPAVLAAEAPEPTPPAPPEPDPYATEGDEARGLAGGAEALLHWGSSKVAGILSHTPQGGDYPEVRNLLTYEPRSPEGKQVTELGKATGKVIDYPGTWVTEKTGIPELGMATNFAIQQAPFLLARAPVAGEDAAEAGMAGVTGNRSAGSAAAATDLSRVTPELRAAAQEAHQSGTLHQEALDRQARAESLPMPEGETPPRLTKGQAARDSQQISDERNLRQDPDTGGLLTDRFDEQSEKAALSLGEIRRRATPDIVQRNNLDHGQAAIDSIKAEDNALVTATRAKYKALADQNGGAMPIDKGAAATTADAALKKGYLSKLVDDHPVLGPIMEKLRSGDPMTFEDWESATKALSEVQRKGSSEGTAAGIIREQFENMPLSEGAQGLRGMLNDAKASAKERFDRIRQNPAYKAAVEDNVPKDEHGLHEIGAPSPLADRFMDQYFLGDGKNASRAYVSRIKGVVKDPEFSKTIEAAALNNLRDAAGIDQFGTPRASGFGHASYRNARNALEPKADVLMSPESAEHTANLRDFSSDVTWSPPGTEINRAGTAGTLNRFGAQFPAGSSMARDLASMGGDVAAMHMGGPVVLAKKIGEKVWAERSAAKSAESIAAAKRAFAEDAVAPGAGVNARMPVRQP